MAKADLTAQRLRELLHYDPETGVFTWLVRRHKNPAGMTAGTPDKDGYIQIGIDRHCHKGHQLAWLYMYGDWPTQQVDHRDRVRSNNQLLNLRLATPGQNGQNRSVALRNNKTGVLGVSPNGRGKFVANIGVDGRAIYLGTFATVADAAEARSRAKVVHHPFFEG